MGSACSSGPSPAKKKQQTFAEKALQAALLEEKLLNAVIEKVCTTPILALLIGDAAAVAVDLAPVPARDRVHACTFLHVMFSAHAFTLEICPSVTASACSGTDPARTHTHA